MDMLIFLASILIGVPIVLSVVALTIASRSRSERGAPVLNRIIEQHERRLTALESELRALLERMQTFPAAAPPEPAPAEKPVAAKEAAPPPQGAPAMIPEAVAEPRPPKPIMIPEPQPLPKAPEAGPPKARPAEFPLPPSPSPPPRAPAFKVPSFDWEGLVGVRLFSWIAGVALLLAAIFFLRYSIDRGWLMPPVRMAIGLLVGVGLLVLCETKAAHKYRITANAMDASAVAILFSTFYAACALWGLIGIVTGFLLLALVTAVAVLLSIRRDSLFIAFLGLVGGFSTPALLSTGENRPIPLFGYLLLLNVGLASVASRKKWPLLTTLSLVFTTLYQWTWVAHFLTSGQLPLAIGVFLVFPISIFVALALGRKEEAGKGWISLYGQTANLSATLPLLFAFYVASVPGFGAHYILLFSFLFLLVAGLFVIATVRGPESLHTAGGLSAILVFAVWLMDSYKDSAWPFVLAFIALFVLFYLVAPLIARRIGRSYTGLGKRAVFAAPLLLFTFPALAAMEPRCAGPGLLFAVLFLLIAAAAAFAMIAEEGAVYFLAAFFAVAAEAVWSSKYLTADRLLAALALYGIFGLLYIGVPMLARRWNKRLQPEGANAVLLLASLALLFFLVAGPAADVALWGLALILLVLNVGLFLEGSASKLPLRAIAGIVLSWIILAVLWTSVTLHALLMPALAVVAGFALLVMAGSIWLQREATGREAVLLGHSVFLGLVGHLFLLVVAAHKSLAVPPWPLLGVLLVLDLAIGTAALYTRRYDLHLAAMVASAFLLMVWVAVAGTAPWPSVGVLSAGALVFFSFVWIYLAGRIGMETAPFARATAITVILAQFVAIVAGLQPGSPQIGFLLPAHLVFLVALLALAWVRGAHVLAIIAVIPAAVAVSLWQVNNSRPEFWWQQILFAGLIYLVFLCYPLLLGRRAGRSLEPYLAAALASVPFFFQARYCMIAAGFGGAIGILPVAQAALMALLLMKLLDIEPPGGRTLGRLALIAGAGLAFVTVAIPLQLEHEWLTLGWALEGAALAWLYGKIPHRGLLYAASGLLATVFVRLALNPSVLEYQSRGALRILNWYLYTYLVSAAAMILAGRLLLRTRDGLSRTRLRVATILPAAGVVLLFLLLNIEIADFYSVGPTITFNFSATLAQDLTYTLGWALFAVALLAVGIVIQRQSARIAAIALLAVTILKCFVHDLARLGGLYRVMSFVGLALCLALVALVLQRFVLSVRTEGK